MENASKALLIAGGMLIALLIIGALVLMFNQIGDYEKGQQGIEKTSEIAEFNKDFERYLDDKGITGADVVSLINKVIDYNKKAKNGGVNNSVDYSIKMSITVKGLNQFNEQYSYNNEKKYIFFNKDEYTVGNNNDNLTNQLKEDLDNAIKAENYGEMTKDQLKEVSGIYDKSKSDSENKKNIENKIKEITGKDWNETKLSLDTIVKYRQYWEFKTSKFIQDGNIVYGKNGQITNMTLKFYK